MMFADMMEDATSEMLAAIGEWAGAAVLLVLIVVSWSLGIGLLMKSARRAMAAVDLGAGSSDPYAMGGEDGSNWSDQAWEDHELDDAYGGTGWFYDATGHTGGGWFS